MTTIHIMIDLETWGTEPGSDIRSIGACVFDPLTGVVADGSNPATLFYIACDNPILAHHEWSNPEHLGGGTKTLPDFKYLLRRDPQTVQWWSEQSAEAQAAFIDPVDLKQALIKFGEWMTLGLSRWVGDKDTRIWSHGGSAQSSFDVAILYAAYKAVGLPVPWHYRAPRDTRTAFDMAGIEDHSAWLDRYKTGTHHHALDDAICQAKAVCGAYGMVKSGIAREALYRQQAGR